MNYQFNTSQDIVKALQCDGKELIQLLSTAAEVRNSTIGNGVNMRGLIEVSNICRKGCLYCGIRHNNGEVHRYSLTMDDILNAARFAHTNGYGSVVMQAGERSDKPFVDFIDNAIRGIKDISNGELGITLSLGEQTEQTYARWFQSGAHRYLLRIESSNKELYNQIHPNDALHSYDTRINALNLLKQVGYQTGTGVMIGLPWQTMEHLANDLLFFRHMDIDMVGMGPYLEHQSTPLYHFRHLLASKEQRLELTLKMIAILRIMMPNINIAATTALQTINPDGRETALSIGANIIMPNITPQQARGDYKLYENKPQLNELSPNFLSALSTRIADYGCQLQLNSWGDSLHFKSK
ncbi:MAG: [FeFe] hydrogenase H-cluster radical SAM maturase HydE [Marinifilaceae bacterium]